MKAHTESLSVIVHRRRDTLISWFPPPDDWVSINTDGSVIQPNSRAAAGGAIRDSQGRCLASFSANLGSCSIMRAELRAAEIGLTTAWGLGLKKVILQMDSFSAVSAIEEQLSDVSRHSSIIHEFQELKSRSWDISITHVFREANCGADYLANLGHSYCFGLHLFSQPNSSLAYWLRFDLIGVASPRAISYF
ncbi:Putative ribonuclease H protein At1g65750 [Linum perenne]